jgi:hypothetical protein
MTKQSPTLQRARTLLEAFSLHSEIPLPIIAWICDTDNKRSLRLVRHRLGAAGYNIEVSHDEFGEWWRIAA